MCLSKCWCFTFLTNCSCEISVFLSLVCVHTKLNQIAINGGKRSAKVYMLVFTYELQTNANEQINQTMKMLWTFCGFMFQEVCTRTWWWLVPFSPRWWIASFCLAKTIGILYTFSLVFVELTIATSVKSSDMGKVKKKSFEARDQSSFPMCEVSCFRYRRKDW